MLGLVADGGARIPKELSRNDISRLEVLGAGNFGEVHKGLLRQGGVPFLVAIKSLFGGLQSDRDEALRESCVMAQFDHAHIAGLIGVVTVGDPLLLVVEFCEYGSLAGYLKQTATVSVLERRVFAHDVADALAYLALRNFVHRDIAARNVLVSSEKRGKLGDFGMSRDQEEKEYYTVKSDVWSFGILLYEIETRAALPYAKMGNQKVWVSITDGYRLPAPDGCSPDLYAIMASCWQAEPQDRPQPEHILALLTVMMQIEAALAAAVTPVSLPVVTLSGILSVSSGIQSTDGQESSSAAVMAETAYVYEVCEFITPVVEDRAPADPWYSDRLGSDRSDTATCQHEPSTGIREKSPKPPKLGSDDGRRSSVESMRVPYTAAGNEQETIESTKPTATRLGIHRLSNPNPYEDPVHLNPTYFSHVPLPPTRAAGPGSTASRRLSGGDELQGLDAAEHGRRPTEAFVVPYNAIVRDEVAWWCGGPWCCLLPAAAHVVAGAQAVVAAGLPAAPVVTGVKQRRGTDFGLGRPPGPPPMYVLPPVLWDADGHAAGQGARPPRRATEFDLDSSPMTILDIDLDNFSGESTPAAAVATLRQPRPLPPAGNPKVSTLRPASLQRPASVISGNGSVPAFV